MHIDEAIDYPGSVFNKLIKDAFADDKHYINILNIGSKALLARVHLIRMAKKSINIQIFIWSNDDSGKFLAYELTKAARRGVEVNVLIDAMGNKKDPYKGAVLAKEFPNINIKYYNPVGKVVKPSALQLVQSAIKDFKKLNQRMHNKIFIVDDKIAITGGRNHQDDYFDRGKKRNFKDRECLIIGPIVKKMTDSFMDYWAFKGSVSNEDMLDVKNKMKKDIDQTVPIKEFFNFGETFDELNSQLNDSLFMEEQFIEKTSEVKKIEFFADGPGKSKYSRQFKGPTVTQAIMELVSRAQSSIIMQTPYLVLPKLQTRAFARLRRKKPDLDIRVSGNSLAAADHLSAYAVSYQNKKKILKKLKWRIFEFKLKPKDLDLIVPPINLQDRADSYFTVIHAKSYIVDEKEVFIGSFNIDPRSINLNTEAGVIIYDEKIAKDVAQDILQDMAPQNSWTIGKRLNVPLVSYFSGILEDIINIVPFLDIWPFSYSASFQLKPGMSEVPFYHNDFYNNYRSVGPFPDVQGPTKAIETMLFKAFFGKLIEPAI
jgi:phosphatidylserine/phosphatidylglycerophosphate/cardiolipin synthase-like enzyme